jgi:hypothetical protein
MFGVSFRGSLRFGSVRRDDRFVSFRLVSFRFAVIEHIFRFVSFPFHRRFVTSVSLLEEKITICW